MDVQSTEPELRGLMVASQGGDADAHKALLERLSASCAPSSKDSLGAGRSALPRVCPDLEEWYFDFAYSLILLWLSRRLSSGQCDC